jgi:hypothetical protein
MCVMHIIHSIMSKLCFVSEQILRSQLWNSTDPPENYDTSPAVLGVE